MKLTVAVKSNGKWSLLECVAIDSSKLDKLLKKRFKKVDAVVMLESEELLAVDVFHELETACYQKSCLLV